MLHVGSLIDLDDSGFDAAKDFAKSAASIPRLDEGSVSI